MPRSFTKRSARHLSYLLPILLVTGCSQTAHKDNFSQSNSNKFSVFTRNPNGKLHLGKKSDDDQDQTREHNTVWDRMESLYALPEMDNARIDREINFYLKNPEYLSRVQQRAEPYLYFILNEIEAKKIPGELALLPAVESAFRPDAKSPAQASGLWQFIPPTGRLYGLKQNSWYDGRRDIVESTQAATTFLKELSETFNNDWLLALASYNAGKGNIKNAVDRNIDKGQPTDFWSLNLNSETSAYVPRLLAIAKIFAHPEKYNVNLHPIPNEPYFELVDIKSQIDLGKAAELAQTPLDHFFKLNPGFNRKTTDPNGPHRLLIPVDKADAFKEKLAELPHQDRVKWEHHTVAANENLKNIAKQHNTSVNEILAINHLDSDEVAEGKILLIPDAQSQKEDDNETVAASSHSSTHTPQTEQTSRVYTVKKGDTLKSLAKSLAVDKDDLLSWNKLSSKAELKPGQKLTIRKTSIAVAATSNKKAGKITLAAAQPATKQISYTVKNGDSLGQISKKFNVNVTDLRKWNNVPKNKAEIKPGSKLKLMIENNHSAT